jgi:hypothetical protein
MPEELENKLLDINQLVEFDNRIAPLARHRSIDVDYPSGVFNIEITNRCPLNSVAINVHIC